MARGLNIPQGDPTIVRQTPPPEAPVDDESTSFLPDKMPADGALQAPSIQNDASGDLQLPDQRPALQDVHDSVAKADPDHTAKVLSLADKLQQPASFIDKNLPDAQKAAIAPGGSFFQSLEKDYPGTTQFLMSPQNMAVSKDDLPNLAEHEGLINHVKDAWNFEKDAFTSGALQEELAFTRFHQMAGDPEVQGYYSRLGGTVANSMGITASDPEARAQAIQKQLDVLQAQKPTGISLKRGLYGATEFVPQILGDIGSGVKYGLPAAGAAALAGAPTGPGEAAIVPAAATAGFTAGEVEYNYRLMSGLSYDSLLKVKDADGKPLDPNVAKIAAASMGAATAGLSLVKLGAVLDSIPGGKDFLAKFSASQVPKVLESPATMSAALQTFAKNWVTATAHGVGAMAGITAINAAGTVAAKSASGQPFPENPDNPIEFATNPEFQTQMKESVTDAALTFGMLTLPGSAMSLHQDVQTARKADQTRAVYTALGDVAERSKLRERMPQVYQDHVAALSKDTPVENIYVPVKDMETYFQGKNIDTETAMKELGVSKSYLEAKQTGGDVQISTATWADKIVGTEHFQGLRDDVKFSPDDFTPRQVQERINESQAQLKLVADQQQASAEQDQKISDFHESADRVEAGIRDQLKAAGLTPQEVKLNPQLYGAFFRTLGEKMGVPPEEVAKRFPLQIGRGDETAMNQERAPERVDARNLKNPESAIKELGTRERADRLQAQMETQIHAADDRINAAGGRDKAASRDILARKDAADTLSAISKYRDKLPSESKTLEQGKGSTDLTASERKYFEVIFGNDANRAELKEQVPSVKFENGRLTVADSDRTALADFVTHAKISREGERLPPSFYNNKFALKVPSEESSLDQSDGGEPRGRIRFGTQGSDRLFHIDLLKGADKSTFLHETGHYFLEVFGDIAKAEDAHSDLKADYDGILKWLGVDKREDIGTDEHEKFARGFEQYLREGNAPSPGLRGAFGRFRDWLTKLYTDMKQLRVELTPEVRGIMDRMLASKEEVELAQARVGQKFDEIPNLTPELQAKIQGLQDQARDLAERQLMKEQMKEMSDKHQEMLVKERARLTEDAKEQVKQQPLYKAIEELNGESNKAKVATSRAQRFIKAFAEGKGHDAEFESLAEIHGFADGLDLARHVVRASEEDTFNKAVKDQVDAGMHKYADLRTKPEIQLEALKAVHNEKMGELLSLERQTLLGLVHKADVSGASARRNRIEAAIEAKAARDQAEKMLADKPIKEAGKAGTYITAERNAAQRVTKAIAKGDYDAAAQAKREQLLSHALVAEALRNQERIEKTVDYLKKFQDRKGNLLNMPYGFVRQIDAILQKFGLSERRPEDSANLQKMANQMARQGTDPGEIANRTGFKDGQTQESLADFVARQNETYHSMSLPDSVMGSGNKPYEDLKLQDLRDVQAAVKTIAHLGQAHDRYLGEYKTMDIKEAAAAFRKSVSEKFGTPFEKDLLPGSQHSTKFQEFLSSLARIPATFDRVLDTILTTCHKLDGLEEGPAKDNIYRPFEMAESKRLARTGEAMKELDGIFSAHYKLDDFAKYKDTKIFDHRSNRYFTKEEILSMALNWGNEGNRQRLIDGFGWDDGHAQTLFRVLGKNDWDFAQATWDHIDKYWPEISQLEMEVNGVEPGKVKPEGFSNEHGNYKGGYYPIKYDFNRSADAYQTLQQKDALYKQFGTAKATTDQGHAQARVTQVTRPLLLSLDVLREHHENVIHDLEMRRAVIDVSRFLGQKDTKAALTQAIGVKGYAGINDWLKAAAGGGGEPLTAFDKAAQWFRFKTTFFNLAYRMVSAPKIAVENIINLSSELGMSGAARAVKDYYMGNNGTHETVIGKSEFMKERANHLDRDMGDITDKWKGEAQGSFKRFAFFVHAYLDAGVSFPLWADTYSRGMSSHGDEQLAINQADESVKRTFMSGGKVDQPAIMRGSEKQKALTTAYGYQSMMWNRFSQQKFQAGQEWAQGNHAASAAIAARAFVYTFAMPAVTAALVSEFMRNNQSSNPDDRNKRIAAKLAEEATPMKFIPVLRDLAPYFIHKAMGERSSDLHVTPLEEAAQTLIDPMAEVLATAGGKRLPDRFPEQVVNSVSMMAGVPKQFNDAVFNFMDWQKNHGELTWRDALTRRTKK